MSKQKTKLWGIQEILGGNQNKILACMPIIEYAKRIGAIREICWNIKSGVGIQWLDSQRDIKNMEEQTTKLNSKKEIEIYSGQLPILIGPLFFSEIENLSFDIGKDLKNVYEIQQGYKVLLQYQDSYESFKKDLFTFSKRIFEEELKASNKKFISPRAKSALELFVGNPSSPQKEYYLMTLAQEKLEGNTQEYQGRLRLASIDLEKPEKEVAELFADYLGNL